MPGKRYDQLTPEEVEAERARKRGAKRHEWVKKWAPRIEEEVKRERERNTE